MRVCPQPKKVIKSKRLLESNSYSMRLCASILFTFRIKGKTRRQTTVHTIQMCSTITCSGLRLTHMRLYNMHNIHIYNQSRSPPDRHPQLVIEWWHRQGWIIGGSPYSSRRYAGFSSERTPHECENARISIGCKLACASICPTQCL